MSDFVVGFSKKFKENCDEKIFIKYQEKVNKVKIRILMKNLTK